eukprot:CAMPEP_0197526310 /NCGR_PEP_ID=MMETSP1318-20131121/17273_1 /TAXON_ID=552666 /ORGANISM="Partenskyella glossopodia, Strain RCC365" /LENGTH=291 /DNA_ID=CAMNT_0043080415 /DNA_START=81 /DNA_END=956 /DNA_ORIENTATION=-
MAKAQNQGANNEDDIKWPEPPADFESRGIKEGHAPLAPPATTKRFIPHTPTFDIGEEKRRKHSSRISSSPLVAIMESFNGESQGRPMVVSSRPPLSAVAPPAASSGLSVSTTLPAVIESSFTMKSADTDSSKNSVNNDFKLESVTMAVPKKDSAETTMTTTQTAGPNNNVTNHTDGGKSKTKSGSAKQLRNRIHLLLNQSRAVAEPSTLPSNQGSGLTAQNTSKKCSRLRGPTMFKKSINTKSLGKSPTRKPMSTISNTSPVSALRAYKQQSSAVVSKGKENVGTYSSISL